MFEYNWGKEGPFTAQQNEMGRVLLPTSSLLGPHPMCIPWLRVVDGGLALGFHKGLEVTQLPLT